MRVGLTYDLRSDYGPRPDLPDDFYAEFDSEEIIAALESAIRAAGHSTHRIGNARKLVQFIAGGETVDIIFNIAEGLWGRSREAQIPAILEAHEIPYTFSDPATLGLCQDKALTKRIWQLDGLATPAFTIISGPAPDSPNRGLNGRLELPGEFPLFVKPLYEGTSKGISEDSVVWSVEQLQARAEYLLNRYQQPVLVEPYLTGREFTVGILGTGASASVLGILEVVLKDPYEVYGFRQKEECETQVLYYPVELDELGRDIAELSLQAYRALGCRDAGRVDLRLNRDGRPQLLEINPLPGLDPEYSSLPIIARNAGLSFNQLIIQMLNHALERLSLGMPGGAPEGEQP